MPGDNIPESMGEDFSESVGEDISEQAGAIISESVGGFPRNQHSPIGYNGASGNSGTCSLQLARIPPSAITVLNGTPPCFGLQLARIPPSAITYNRNIAA